MTEILAWCGEHPILAVLFVWSAANVLKAPFYYPAWAYNRHVRSKNIREKGWPPAHLDADGDPIKKDDE